MSNNKKNGASIAGVILSIISIVLYVLTSAFSIVFSNTDYWSDIGLGIIFAGMGQLALLFGITIWTVVLLAILQLVQLVLFIVGCSVRRLPKKPMIASGILLFFSTIFASGYLIITYMAIESLG